MPWFVPASRLCDPHTRPTRPIALHVYIPSSPAQPLPPKRLRVWRGARVALDPFVSCNGSNSPPHPQRT